MKALEFSDVMTVITMIAVLLTVADNIVLGVAIARIAAACHRWCRNAKRPRGCSRRVDAYSQGVQPTP